MKRITAAEFLESKGWRQSGDFWIKGRLKLLEEEAFAVAYKKRVKGVFIIQQNLFGGKA